MSTARAFAARQSHDPVDSGRHPSTRRRSQRRRHRHSVLRRLPLRPAQGARRVAGVPTVYPCVPGHEIVGACAQVGAEVTGFKRGRSCSRSAAWSIPAGTCASCKEGQEQYCNNQQRPLHLQLPDTHGAPSPTAATPTRSWSTSTSCCTSPTSSISRRPRRCSAPASRPIPRSSTGTSARARNSASSASAGSGTWAVKFGARVRRARRAVHDVAEQGRGRKRLGADEVVISKDAARMAAHARSFDFILDTVSAPHDIDPFICICSSATARWCWSARPSSRSRRRRIRAAARPPRVAGGLGDRRHRRDAGDAGLLREREHRVGHRADPDSADQRGL